jgi:Ca2+-binding EF-hand superfamily protein
MRLKLWFAAVAVGSWLGSAAPASARVQGKDGRRMAEEEHIVQVIDQARTTYESERERLVTALRRFAVANGGAAAGSDEEVDDWFRLVAEGKMVWKRDAIASKSLIELFDFLAERIDITNEQITQAQFTEYARKLLSDDDTPLWKAVEKLVAAEVNKVFREYDRDNDGQLTADEMSGNLRSERQQWDKNRDGVIDRAEYRAYFLNRAQKVLAEVGRRAAKGDGRSMKGGGKQSDGLPAWFNQLDADRDGQIGLYEWRESGWPVADFQRLDRNGDGLLTADEVLWAVARAKERGTPDAALTRQLPPDFRKKGGGEDYAEGP